MTKPNSKIIRKILKQALKKAIELLEGKEVAGVKLEE